MNIISYTIILPFFVFKDIVIPLIIQRGYITPSCQKRLKSYYLSNPHFQANKINKIFNLGYKSKPKKPN